MLTLVRSRRPHACTQLIKALGATPLPQKGTRPHKNRNTRPMPHHDHFRRPNSLWNCTEKLYSTVVPVPDERAENDERISPRHQATLWRAHALGVHKTVN